VADGSRVDVGLTHIAFAVRDVEASIAFYEHYLAMRVVHERPAEDGLGRIVWMSDLTRPFVVVLVPSASPDPPLGPFGHLGVGLASRGDVDRLAADAAADGRLRMGPSDAGPPVGYWVFLDDPDGNTIELTHGQEVGLAVFGAAKP
jgi:catechol 2,3-dioxygenase-like lactoylglutathione lyase family enzyme